MDVPIGVLGLHQQADNSSADLLLGQFQPGPGNEDRDALYVAPPVAQQRLAHVELQGLGNARIKVPELAIVGCLAPHVAHGVVGSGVIGLAVGEVRPLVEVRPDSRALENVVRQCGGAVWW